MNDFLMLLLSPMMSFMQLYSIQIIMMMLFLITGLTTLLVPDLGYRLALLVRKLNARTLKLKLKEVVSPTKKRILLKRVNGAITLVIVLGLLLYFRPDFRLASPVAGVEHRGATAQQRANLVEKELSNLMEKKYIPSAAVAIVSDGEISYHTVGSKLDTVYEIGSLSKVFTGILLAKALEDEVVTLDAPLNSYLPLKINGKNSFFDEVNLKQLTTHTSGFPRQPLPLTVFPQYLLKSYLVANPYSALSDELIYKNMLTLKPKSQPGERYSYSNYGVGVLGHVLTLRYGKDSYEELCKEMIFSPLELKDTTITLNANQQWRFNSGYSTYCPMGPLRVGIRSKPWVFPETLTAAGGIRSTIVDMSRFLQANMEVHDSIYATAHQPLFPIDEELAIGMGWFTSYDDDMKSDVICHDGQTAGFTSFMGFTSDRRHGIVILTNSSKSVNKLGFSLLAELDKKS